MEIHPTKFMGFYGVFMDISWVLYKGFYCSLSEAQKGAEDKGQIKAQLGWLPVREAAKNELREFIGLEEISKPTTQQGNQGLTPCAASASEKYPSKSSLASSAPKESLAESSFSLPFPSTSMGSACSSILSSLTH